ncbi:hypothetical protein CIPAW_13G060800 [Carya illinoinensis]|uniref:non-specific serine/threonine protein kinase n=2 Tax=Carya illinoinensis TaxID=32201 RepID=A0A8T1NQH6_CARIL|nr:hypothetical protein CIPAW_13G060800 [Carya illinoinensis]
MSKLFKLSLRNCNLQGPIPDLSRIPNLYYLDLSSNQLNGSIPPGRFCANITTINLSNNNITGTVPANFSGLPKIQRLSLSNNSLSGSIPSTIWQNRILHKLETLMVDLQNNKLSSITGSTTLPLNVTVRLRGNPVCSIINPVQFCGSESKNNDNSQSLPNTNTSVCLPQRCLTPYEYSPTSPAPCFCAAPLLIGYRLKSPGFSDFRPYRDPFEKFLAPTLHLFQYQLHIDSFIWEKGPRLRMYLKLFPVYDANIKSPSSFNMSEVQRILHTFVSWKILNPDVFGPYEVLNFTHKYDNSPSPRFALSKGALVGVVLGTIAASVTLSVLVSLLTLRRVHTRNYPAVSRRRRSSNASRKIDGVKSFTFGELAMATNNFNTSTQVGEGGYGKVYKGILADGTVVAIKRAQEGSLQGEREFLTEIELLSRCWSMSLCQMVLLRDHLSARCKEPLSFAMRLRIALGSAKGILYLHTEADPPIFHRDIKATNILLDSKYTAKVADFGLSRLAPVPDIEGTMPAHVSTVVKGTPGYLDPEYFLTHQLTDKSDVYSLGVVFLELLTAMQPIAHGKNIVREVKVAYKSGMIFSVIDQRMDSYPSDYVVKFFSLAMRCCEDETDARPSMAEVVRELESIWLSMGGPDIKMSYPMPMITDAVKLDNLPSSSSMENPFVSMSTDASGSNLVSGVIPTITPR